MQIGSLASQAIHQPTTRPAGSEAAERGPDNDGDADDKKVAAASTPTSGTTTAVRGNTVNVVA